MSTLTAERQLGLKTVGNATDNKDFLIALRIALSVNNVVNGAGWQFRRERQPLLRRKYARHAAEVVVRIRSGKLKGVVYASHLESRIAYELMVERKERGVLAGLQTRLDNGRHLPFATDTIEYISLDITARKVYALHHDMIDGGVLHDIHLLHVVENKRVEILMHEEVVHLPAFLGQKRSVLTRNDGQGENDSLHLKLSVGGEIEEEIVEQLVCSRWHRSLRDNLVESVCSRRVRNGTDAVGVNWLRFLTRTTYRRKTYHADENAQHNKHNYFFHTIL